MVYFVGEIKFLIRLFILLLSCYGYIQYLRKTVRLEFCIGLLFSGIGSALFLAGILNLLREATFGFGRSIHQKEREPGKCNVTWDPLFPGTCGLLPTPASWK